MTRRLILGVLFLFIGSSNLLAQDAAILPIVSLPPTPGETVLTTGTAVSRPLQPVTMPDPSKTSLKDPPANIPAVESEKSSPDGLPSSWSRYDLLFWYPKAQPLPPLVTGSASNVIPTLGNPLTTVLVGNHAIDSPTSMGGRFTWGWACGSNSDVGVEATYFFTGTRSSTAIISGSDRNINYGRPLVDPLTGKDYVLPISTPGNRGSLIADSQNRMTGWEVNGVINLARSEQGYINALVGYRYFMNNEGIRLAQITPLSANSYADAADQFDGHTRFHGGQIGLEGSLDFNRFYIGMIGKIAFGRSVEVVNVGGQTNIISSNGGLPVQGGVLAVGSNIGRQSNTNFAVLPEGQLNLGYRFRDHSKFFIGYNFIYLSDAVRPGDQIDRTVAINSIPMAVNGVPTNLGLRPEPMFKRTDFWVQGITLGFDYKY
ncbi:MAG: BBP7 family outer membrane beta-barrel protein [Gemmataceae bacterium]